MFLRGQEIVFVCSSGQVQGKRSETWEGRGGKLRSAWRPKTPESLVKFRTSEL